MNNIFNGESSIMENNKQKIDIFTKLFSISFLFLVNNFSLVRFGIPTNITLGKFGAAILLIVLLLKLKNAKLTKGNLYFFMGFCIFLAIYLISTIITLNSDFLNLFMSYTEVLLLMIVSAFILDEKFNMMGFIKIISLGSLLINIFVLSDVVINLGINSLSNPEIVRHYLIFDFKFRALNALMNGLLFIVYFSFGVILKKQYWDKKIYYLSIFNSVIFVILAVLSGSRQTLVGILVFFIIYMFFNSSLIKFNFKSMLKSILTISGSYLLLNIVFSFLNINLFNWISHRFGNKEINSIEDLDSRVVIVNEGLKLFFTGNNILLGYGMDGFNEEIGINAHNGFVKILFETGIIGFFFFLIFIFYYMIKIFKGIYSYKKTNSDCDYHISCFLFSILLTFTFVMNFFKEIFEYHYYWIFFLIIIKFSIKEIRSS
jgi:O-antigen ligase